MSLLIRFLLIFAVISIASSQTFPTPQSHYLDAIGNTNANLGLYRVGNTILLGTIEGTTLTLSNSTTLSWTKLGNSIYQGNVNGAVGPTGVTGEPGATGSAGPRGATGPQGQAGVNGFVWVTSPTATNSTGSPGDVAYTNNYFYICVASNLWRRATLAGW